MKIASVKINDNSKVLYYDASEFDLKPNLTVIVSNDYGLQFAKVVDVFESDDRKKYEKIIRIASKKDYLQNIKNKKEEEIALSKCRELVKKNNLNMNVIDANYNFDKSQLIFRFLSDERVDFRQLAKDLGSKLKTRIELRQIGIRDKAKEIGGLGPCGRFLCCNTFLNNFDTVSISMAKTQGIALNPTKINGVCGRLLCCLTYENDQYKVAKKDIPDVGKKVEVDGKEGKVLSASPLLGKYKILIDNQVVEVDVNDSKK